MAVLPILHFPDSRLRTKAVAVKTFDDKLQTLIDDMFETMYEAKGVGLAGSQVDAHIQLVVMDLSEDRSAPQVFINPKITPLTEEKRPYEEGCLSVPTAYDSVERPIKVKIEALDRHGTPFTIEEATELLAVCIQHEIDHLNGVLFVDYLSAFKRNRIKEKLLKQQKMEERANKKK